MNDKILDEMVTITIPKKVLEDFNAAVAAAEATMAMAAIQTEGKPPPLLRQRPEFLRERRVLNPPLPPIEQFQGRAVLGSMPPFDEDAIIDELRILGFIVERHPDIRLGIRVPWSPLSVALVGHGAVEFREPLSKPYHWILVGVLMRHITANA